MSYIDKLDKEMKRRFGAVRVKFAHGPLVDNVYYNIADGTIFGDLENFAEKNDLRVSPCHRISDVVIEVPRKTRKTIFTSDLLARAAYKDSKATLPVVAGVDTMGRTIVWDLRKISNLLIGGRIGSGKSNFMNSIIKSLTTRLSSKQCQFMLIDTKGFEFNAWDNTEHLICPVITENDKAMEALKYIVKEADERCQKIKTSRVRNIEGYNKNNVTPMPYVVVIIDEFAGLVKQSKRDFEISLMRITQRADVCGIHLIMATEHLKSDTLIGAVKASMSSRIVFQTQNKAQSKAVLGEGGAKNLFCCGDALFSYAGRAPLRIHTPYLDDLVEANVVIQKKERSIDITKKLFKHVEDNSLTEEILEESLGQDIDLDLTKDCCGRTLLMSMCDNPICTPQMVEKLIKAGADVNLALDGGQIALFYADAEKSNVLLKYGADVNHTDELGRNALMVPYALSVEKAQLLIKNGIDVNHRDNTGETALMQATDYNIVRLLVENGADLSAEDDFGYGVMDGCTYADVEALKFLLKEGAKIKPNSCLAKIICDDELACMVRKRLNLQKTNK